MSINLNFALVTFSIKPCRLLSRPCTSRLIACESYHSDYWVLAESSGYLLYRPNLTRLVIQGSTLNHCCAAINPAWLLKVFWLLSFLQQEFVPDHSKCLVHLLTTRMNISRLVIESWCCVRPAVPAVTILPVLFFNASFQDYDLSESCHYYCLEGY